MTAFDYVLSVTDQTAGTVTLTTAPFQVKQYQPVAGARDEASVAETIEIRLDDGSPANNLAEVRALNNLLRQAERAQDARSVDKVYLTWKESASATEYRSEILAGRVEWEDTALLRDYWTNDVQFANVYIERRNYWEGTLTQIPLTNPNGTANLSGLTVYNDNSGLGSGTLLHYNYADIAGTAVTGDLPAPVKLDMYYNSGYRFGKVRITNNVSSAGTFTHWQEGELLFAPWQNVIGQGTAVVVGQSSGSVLFGTIGSGSVTYLNLSTTGAINAAAGNFAKVSAVMRSATITPYEISVGNPYIGMATSTLYWTPIGTTNYYPVEMGVVKFPAHSGTLVRSSMPQIYIKQESGSDAILYVDSIQVAPCDYTIQYDFGDNVVWATYTAYLDPYEDDFYSITDAGGFNASGAVSYGDLKAEPGDDQRLYFQFSTWGTAEYDIGGTAQLTMKAYYRPRRLSL